MENPERDQGQPVGEPTSDPAAQKVIAPDGDGAAVGQEGTVGAEGVDAKTSIAPRGEVVPADAKGKETDEGDPYAELLEKYVPLEKDYSHAQKMITKQGQELSARDAEMTQLRADMQGLQTTINQRVSEDDGYETVGDGEAVSGKIMSELQRISERLVKQDERLNVQEDALISNITETQRERGVKTVQAELGLNDELATAVQSLREKGDIDGAIALAGKAAVIADAQRTKEAQGKRQVEPIISGETPTESTDVQEPEPLKRKDLPEDISKRGGFHLDRIKKAFGL